MSNTIQMVEEFMHACDQLEFTEPTNCAPEVSHLRYELIAEELRELGDAIKDDDLTAVLDALCDLQYVLDGTFIAYGMQHVKAEAFYRTHESNMSKLDDDGRPIKDERGKVQKGPRYHKPNFQGLL